MGIRTSKESLNPDIALKLACLEIADCEGGPPTVPIVRKQGQHNLFMCDVDNDDEFDCDADDDDADIEKSIASKKKRKRPKAASGIRNNKILQYLLAEAKETSLRNSDLNSKNPNRNSFIAKSKFTTAVEELYPDDAEHARSTQHKLKRSKKFLVAKKPTKLITKMKKRVTINTDKNTIITKISTPGSARTRVQSDRLLYNYLKPSKSNSAAEDMAADENTPTIPRCIVENIDSQFCRMKVQRSDQKHAEKFVYRVFSDPDATIQKIPVMVMDTAVTPSLTSIPKQGPYEDGSRSSRMGVHVTEDAQLKDTSVGEAVMIRPARDVDLLPGMPDYD